MHKTNRQSSTDGPIEVRVRHVNQLFHTIDPSPFHERDLDPGAELFIEEWARELPTSAALSLVVHIEGPSLDGEDRALVHGAVQRFFQRKADFTRRRLRDLFRRGRRSLLIAVVFLGILSTVANTVQGLVAGTIGGMLREGLLIGGWVAMWRPLEIFLYDWWPIRAQAQLLDRLAAMPVTIEHVGA